jgi:hypothetical protein
VTISYSPIRLRVASLLLGLVLVGVAAIANAGSVPAAAVTPAQLPGAMRLFGDATTMAARDGRVYFDSWRLLLVADIAGQQEARLVGSADSLFPHLLALRTDGAWLYALDQVDGLVVLSLERPERPRVVARLSLPAALGSLAVADGYAYLAGSGTGLVVVDVRDAERPRLVATFRTPGPSYGVDVQGGLAFVADGPVGVTVVDIRQPERPRLAGGTVPSGITAGRVSADRDGLLLVATDGVGVYVLDTRSAPSLAVLGLVPATLPVSDMAVMGNLVVFGDRDAMSAASLGADGGPGPVSRELTGFGSAVFVHQDRANVARSGRKLVTIRTDALPGKRMVPEWLLLPVNQVVADERSACSVGVEAGRAVLQLLCVDLSAAGAPRPLAAADVDRQMSTTSDAASAAAALHDGRLYLVEGGWWRGSSTVLHIFDLDDGGLTPLGQPALPEIEGVERLLVEGDDLYTVNWLRNRPWITRFSLADPLAPRRLQSLQGASGGRLALAEGRAYLTDGVNLQILNTTNGGLRSLGSLVYNEGDLAGGLTHGVVAVGEIVIVAGQNTGFGGSLAVIDTSLPSHPKILGGVLCCSSHGTGRGVKALARRGNMMAVAGGSGGISLWDIATPETPKTRYEGTGYTTTDVALTASHLVFIDKDASVMLWQYAPPVPTPTATRTGPEPLPSLEPPTATPSQDPTATVTATLGATTMPTVTPSPSVPRGTCFLPWLALSRGTGADP